MDDGICADCTRLHQAALDAIVRHSHARSRLALALAKLQDNSFEIKVLEPVVEHLFRARRAAVRTYQEHVDTHAQKVASAGTT
jgi:hypothetical protein